MASVQHATFDHDGLIEACCLDKNAASHFLILSYPLSNSPKRLEARSYFYLLLPKYSVAMASAKHLAVGAARLR